MRVSGEIYLAKADYYAVCNAPLCFSVMIVGEICNFVAYAFTEAILVTPLGALSVVIWFVTGEFDAMSYLIKHPVALLQRRTVVHLPQGTAHFLREDRMLAVHSGRSHYRPQWTAVRYSYHHTRVSEVLPCTWVLSIWQRHHRHVSRSHLLGWSTVWQEEHACLCKAFYFADRLLF